MREAEAKHIAKHRDGMDDLILLVKAKGGYKFRQRIKLTELELEAAAAACEANLHALARRLAIAETMLQETPRHYHARWEEYQQRCSAT